MNNIKHKMPKEFVQKVKNILDNKESLNGELKHTSEDGKECWFQNSVMPIYDDNGAKLGEVVVRYDITQKKHFEELAITDALTKLYNRRHFNDILTREINRAYRDQKTLSFTILDVDYFKKYNDAYGHQAGDEVLVSVSKTIKESLHRGSDFAFRLGGEEFGVIFSGVDEEYSVEFVERIRANIEALNIEHSNSQVANHITASFGLLVVDFSQESVDEHGFYTMADDALYKAKNSGRNRVSLYENEELEFF
ncbi:MAG: diguanylate cyclase [Campylobacterota bacterium]|nr:diguanylate cyclase [Campylobacterota bacterium]